MTNKAGRYVGGGFLAGGLIAIGDIALMQIDNRYIGALLFSLALLSIIQLGIPLYTGRVGTIIYKHNYGECLIMLLFNSCGACFVTILYMFMDPDIYAANVVNIASTKFQNSFVYLFIAGILCNVLIHMAVTCKNTIITILCIMCFILCGFEHSIADVGYAFCGARGLEYIGKWLVVVLGNTAGGISTELLLYKK